MIFVENVRQISSTTRFIFVRESSPQDQPRRARIVSFIWVIFFQNQIVNFLARPDAQNKLKGHFSLKNLAMKFNMVRVLEIQIL